MLGIAAVVLGVLAFAPFPLGLLVANYGFAGGIFLVAAGPVILGLALLVGAVGFVLGLAARSRHAPRLLWIPAVVVPAMAVLAVGYVIAYIVLNRP